MKKRFLLGAILLSILICVLIAIPICAAQDFSFATLRYVCDPEEQGGEQASGVLGKNASFSCGVTISCNTDSAVLLVDGEEMASGSVYLCDAGRYTLTVKERDGRASFEYELTILPAVNITDGQIFTCFPVVECENATRMTLNRYRPFFVADLKSGTTVEQFGQHVLEIAGKGCTFEIVFYVRPCNVTRSYDAESGKNVLLFEVGEFEGVSVMLDGKELTAGTHTVSAVGQHTVSATQNKEPITLGSALPSKEELFMQVQLVIPETTSRKPITLALSRWDADFYLDGEPVSGNIRIERSGEHVLEIRDADGNVMENALRIYASVEDSGTDATTVTLTFDNPHHTYVIFILIPALALLVLAGCFLVLRRRIV